MNGLRERFIVLLVMILLTLFQMLHFVESRNYWLTEYAWVIQLVADCEIWNIVSTNQPKRTLVLGAPGWMQCVYGPYLWSNRGMRIGGGNHQSMETFTGFEDSDLNVEIFPSEINGIACI